MAPEREAAPSSSHSTTVKPKVRGTRSRSSSTPKSAATINIPERLRIGADADQDVTAPKTRRGQLLNQSFLSMIANVGTNPNFASCYGADDFPTIQEAPVENEPAGEAAAAEERDITQHDADTNVASPRSESQTRKTSGPRSVHDDRGHLHFEAAAEAGVVMSTSQLLPPLRVMSSTSSDGTLDASEQHRPLNEQDSSPVREKVLQASLELQDEEQEEPELAEHIARIFGFEEPEHVLAGHPCSLLQSVMLQGFMYITSKHVCFYAYLPRQATAISKSGFLARLGRQNLKYTRYWFALKGPVLSYYSDPKHVYFPSGTIDLRGDTTVEMEVTGKSRDANSFVVKTAEQRFTLKAESATSAQEWVKQIQQAVFRSHNASDSVKICLPIDNLLDAEESPVLDFATTLRLKVIDNDETYALDEYFFSFYKGGQSALQLLKEKMTDNNATKDLAAISASHHSLTEDENIPSTISSGADEDAQYLQEANFIQGLLVSPDPQLSSADSDSSTSNDSGDAAAMKASRILDRSDMFRRPTIRQSGRHHQKHRLAEKSRTDEDNVELPRSKTPKSKSKSRKPTAPPKKEETVPQQSMLSSSTIKQSSSSSTLQGLMRAGVYPLQKASGIAGLIRNHSRQVGNLLASESRGYYERVSGMWAGKRMHYDESEDPMHEHPLSEGEEADRSGKQHGDRFRTHFSLPESEKLQATYFGHLQGTVLIYGKLYVGETKLCFRSLIPGMRTKMILPLKDIENIDKETGFRFGYSGLCLVVRGHEELFFEFGRPETRDDCAITLLRALEKSRDTDEMSTLPPPEQNQASAAKAEYESLVKAPRHSEMMEKSADLEGSEVSHVSDSSPILFDDMAASIVSFKPAEPQRFTFLTIGSRGDVQPSIALCKGLMAEGHKVKIATHLEFGQWVRSHGIDFVPVAGEPAEIMRLCVENDMFTVSFFREALSKFTGWVDELLDSAWEACQDTDILIESPSAMAGIHIAEALQIPYFRAFTMPWTRTRAYPHAFTVPNQKMGGNYNSFSYVMFDNLFWAPISRQVNRWRQKRLGLPAITLDKMGGNKTPFLYNFSPSVVPPPLDFNHWIHITGYWFLDEGLGYTPPPELEQFIRKARRENKKIVYIGFGSIVVEDPAALTKTIVAAVLKADVRCILSKGWSERLGGADSSASDVALPPEVLQIKSAPHDWLFRQVDAAVHHGGAGTTGASLRAGIPTVVKPFFGDQYFFGSRVQDLGVGTCLKKVNTTTLARALWLATNSERIITKARVLGQRIRNEDGVATAIQAMYRDLEYARSLIRRRRDQGRNTEQSEESWTMIDQDSDSSIAGRLGKGIESPVRQLSGKADAGSESS